jgi:hypothetical protein
MANRQNWLVPLLEIVLAGQQLEAAADVGDRFSVRH